MSWMWVLVAALFLFTVWLELSGVGPRWRIWLEETTYNWVVRKRK